MKKVLNISFALVLILSLSLFAAIPVSAGTPTTFDYGDINLSGGFQTGHFLQVWDLTECDLTISFTYDANGLIDDFGGDAHAWAELGVREVGYGDFNPTWDVEGAGVWLATDYDWAANTFDPDPVSSPTLDLDDKLILQKAGGHGEGDYNLPSTPPNPGANHAVWFDRDGVDPFQALMWGAIDGVTYNTGGTYDIVITLHADSATSGTAYMTINGEPQGFYDPNWHSGPADLMPAGMTFTGDMTAMQVFYGLYGYGATHDIAFNNIIVDGCLAGLLEGMVTGGGWIDSPSGAYQATFQYENQNLLEWQSGYFGDVFNLTKGDLTLSYTIDMSGQQIGGWTPIQVGLREIGQANMDPNGFGGWMQQTWQNPATDPDSADIDDHFLLVDHGWLSDELDYDVDPAGNIVSPFGIYSNYAFWFDRDGVDSFQETYWNYKDGITYNTEGIYEVKIKYHYDSTTGKGTMVATVNGEYQGFYLSGYNSANPPDTQPAGKTFTGDMTQMQVFFGRGGGGGNVVLSNIEVTGATALTGKANFGFVAKYKKGASVPDGQTEFMFQTAGLNFHSTSYDWLVVAGDTARFKGWGTVNGEEGYRFMLWAGDGDSDTFRIKIWTEDTIIYDKGINQPIGGGQIIVHKSK